MVNTLVGRSLLVACAMVFSGLSAGAGEPTLEERAAKARGAVKAFAGELKSQLVAGMKAGGAVSAISVCKSAAPEIASRSSKETGWSVGRTALKLRNPNNAPDDYERKVLEDFVARRAAGADPKMLEHFEIAEKDGEKVFRYMKAIPTGDVCLACHGNSVADDVSAAIKTHYPDDDATGFAKGDIRGAFTIVQPLK